MDSQGPLFVRRAYPRAHSQPPGLLREATLLHDLGRFLHVMGHEGRYLYHTSFTSRHLLELPLSDDSSLDPEWSRAASM